MTESKRGCMILGLAGRRIDAPETAEPAFPLENYSIVHDRLIRLLSEQNVRVLVCSAACGADLLALQAAEALGIRRRIILPFAPSHFRQTSVIDRPGDWGPIFDGIITAAERSGDLINLQLDQGSDSYTKANCAILDEVMRLAGDTGYQVVVPVMELAIKGKGRQHE